MKRIKLLALLGILVFIGIGMRDAVSGFRDGLTENERMFTNNVPLSPTAECVPDTAYFAAAGEQLPYVLGKISLRGTDVRPSSRLTISTLLLAPFALFAFYGFYCFVRMLISVTRGEVFSRRNVRRLRFFVYGLMAAMLAIEVQQWFVFQELAATYAPAGYEAVYPGLKYDWINYILLALLTEIFAVGVTLKEEQDLTI